MKRMRRLLESRRLARIVQIVGLCCLLYWVLVLVARPENFGL